MTQDVNEPVAKTLDGESKSDGDNDLISMRVTVKVTAGVVMIQQLHKHPYPEVSETRDTGPHDTLTL